MNSSLFDEEVGISHIVEITLKKWFFSIFFFSSFNFLLFLSLLLAKKNMIENQIVNFYKNLKGNSENFKQSLNSSIKIDKIPE